MWVIPTIALTAFAVNQLRPQPPDQSAAPLSPIKVPIEVRTAGEASKVIYVEVPPGTIPEPSTSLLLPLSGMLLFRRGR